MDALRILLVDDHILFRKGIASLISNRPDMKIVGEAGDGLEAVTMAQETTPDVILMDVNMPQLNGLEAVKLLQQKMPHVAVVMLTVEENDDALFEAIKHGAREIIIAGPRDSRVLINHLLPLVTKRVHHPLFGDLRIQVEPIEQGPAYMTEFCITGNTRPKSFSSSEIGNPRHCPLSRSSDESQLTLSLLKKITLPGSTTRV